MGLAVAVVSDSVTGESLAFFEHQAEELFAYLRKADLVVGFNIVGFDFKVLSAYDDGTLEHLPVFDILADVRRRLGFRLSLAHLTEHTLGATKTADGLQSLAWIREGRMDLVEEYCRADVRITEQLFRHGLDAGLAALPEPRRPADGAAGRLGPGAAGAARRLSGPAATVLRVQCRVADPLRREEVCRERL